MVGNIDFSVAPATGARVDHNEIVGHGLHIGEISLASGLHGHPPPVDGFLLPIEHADVQGFVGEVDDRVGLKYLQLDAIGDCLVLYAAPAEQLHFAAAQDLLHCLHYDGPTAVIPEPQLSDHIFLLGRLVQKLQHLYARVP